MSKPVSKRVASGNVDWFDLGNYEFINDLTVREFIWEMEARYWLLNNFSCMGDIRGEDEEHKKQHTDLNITPVECLYQRIFKATKENPPRIGWQRPAPKQITAMGIDGMGFLDSIGVSVLTVPLLASLAQRALVQGDLHVNAGIPYAKPQDIYKPAYYLSHDHKKQLLPILLDLGGSTNEEILASIENILPLLRKCSGISGPELKSNGLKEGIIKGLCKWLPAFDLLLFRKMNSGLPTMEKISEMTGVDLNDSKTKKRLNEIMGEGGQNIGSGKYSIYIRRLMTSLSKGKGHPLEKKISTL